MAIASLLALALLATDPQPAAPKMGVALPAKGAGPQATKLDPAAAEKEPLPPGAPADDYGLVAWCYGALQGHMALFEKVKPQLNALQDPDPRATAASDAEMLEAGKMYLNLYSRALKAAEKGNPKVVLVPAATTMAQGRSIWDKAEVADDKTRMWSWVMWVLPGRCEYSAERLYEKSMLAGGEKLRTAPIPRPTAKSIADEKKAPPQQN
jgi:hypothetical protein